MSKETTKAKITAFRALTADNSASPEVVGIMLDEILELDLRPYNIYSALLTQVGTLAPTIIILENTLGDDFTIIYNSIGSYTLRLNNLSLFASAKTSILLNSSYNSNAYLGIVRGNDTDLLISTTFNGTSSNNLMVNDTLEIKVYK